MSEGACPELVPWSIYIYPSCLKIDISNESNFRKYSRPLGDLQSTIRRMELKILFFRDSLFGEARQQSQKHIRESSGFVPGLYRLNIFHTNGCYSTCGQNYTVVFVYIYMYVCCR